MRNACKVAIGLFVLLLSTFIFVFVSGGYRFFGQVSGTRSACERGNAFACYKLGVMYETGNGVSMGLTQAKFYYLKACSMGTKWGCEEASRLEDPKGKLNVP